MNVYNNKPEKPMLPALNKSNTPTPEIHHDLNYYQLHQPSLNPPFYLPNHSVAPHTNNIPNASLLPPLQFYSKPPHQMDLYQSSMHQSPMPKASVSPYSENYGPSYNQYRADSNTSISNGSIKSNGSITSLGSINSNTTASPYYQVDYVEGDKYSIDYSQIINYTISPSLKRKRRLTTTSEDDEMHLPQLPCNVCGKIFNKPYNLKSHMKSHSTEKPYNCSTCGKKFARSHDKKRHELLHRGEKNFKCEGFLKDGTTKWGCGKKFARSDALSRHFRTETGWLCIKPLMDEAKHLESHDLINTILRN